MLKFYCIKRDEHINNCQGCKARIDSDLENCQEYNLVENVPATVNFSEFKKQVAKKQERKS